MSYIVGRLLSSRGVESLAAPLKWVCSYWLGVIFLPFVRLLEGDIFTGFGDLLPHLAHAIRSYALSIESFLAFLLAVQALRAPVITCHDVRLAGLPASLDGTVVAVRNQRFRRI